MSTTVWRLPAAIELCLDTDRLDGSSVVSVDLFEAIDRPDRLEVRLTGLPGAWSSGIRPGGVHTGGIDGARLAGLRVTLAFESGIRFRGVVESAAARMHEGSGCSLTLVAYARYESLRASLRAARQTSSYYQITDGELAGRLAGHLELVPIVDSTPEVHARVDLGDDPLAILRASASRSGRQLAVTGGRLYFVRDLPVLEEVRPPDTRGELLSCDWRCSPSGERRGTMRVLGSPRWRPLTGFHLRGIPGVQAGHYRVDRVLHSLGLDGFRSELEVTERTNANGCGAGS